MTSGIDPLRSKKRDERARSWFAPTYGTQMCWSRRKRQEKKKVAQGSAQPIEKAHFGQANPRKYGLFSLIFFGRACPGFAGLG
jgi:hypothetical protein